jgi:hypothetical protein
MASNLFCGVAYRAAFDFDLGEALFDFEVEVTFVEEGFALVFLVARCVDELCDALALCVFLPRVRVPGASFTGSAMVSTRPGLTAFDDRWFQRLSCSADTLKRSATVTSVSP